MPNIVSKKNLLTLILIKMTTTPQNNDQNLQQAEVTQEDVVIDR